MKGGTTQIAWRYFLDTLTQHACVQVNARKKGWEAARKVRSGYIKAFCGTEDFDMFAGEPSFAAAAAAASRQEAAEASAAMRHHQLWLCELTPAPAAAASAPAISAALLRRALQATPAKRTTSPSGAEQLTCFPHRTLPLPKQWKAPVHLLGGSEQSRAKVDGVLGEVTGRPEGQEE